MTLSSGSLYYKEYSKRLGSRGILLILILFFSFWLWVIICILKVYLFLLLIQGQKERDQCYNPILEELDALFPSRSEERFIFFPDFDVVILFWILLIFSVHIAFSVNILIFCKYNMLWQPSCLFSSWCWTWTVGFRNLTSRYAYNFVVL